MPLTCNNCKHISKCFMGVIDTEIDPEIIHTTQVKYLRRQTICKEGEFSSCIRMIIEGYVMVLAEGPNNKNIIIKILKPGDFLGVSAICGDDIYSFSATALTDALVCSIERESVLGMLVKDGKFALKLAQWYCINYSKLFEKVKTIGFKNLHGRMADAILYLDSGEFKEGDLYKYLSRKDIADLACMPMESAVRIISEFNESKLIRLIGKEIEILDFEMLRKISRNG